MPFFRSQSIVLSPLILLTRILNPFFHLSTAEEERRDWGISISPQLMDNLVLLSKFSVPVAAPNLCEIPNRRRAAGSSLSPLRAGRSRRVENGGRRPGFLFLALKNGSSDRALSDSGNLTT